jgi:hypothetical protein
MAFIDMPNYVQVGKCYQHQNGTYLGKFIGTSAGEPYMEGPGAASNQVRTVYDFENMKGVHEFYRVKEVPCETGGKRRKTKKRVRKHKKTQKRRR